MKTATVLTLIGITLAAATVVAQHFPYRGPRGTVPLVDTRILAALDSLSEVEDAEVVHVCSPESSCADGDRYLGKPLDQAAHLYFRQYYPEIRYPKNPDFDVYATRRINVGPGLIGYLLRVPGMYNVSTIDLWVYDSQRSAWRPPVELADHWGDAGEVYEAQAWLVDLKGDGYRDVVKRGKFRYFKKRRWDRLGVQGFRKDSYASLRRVTDRKLMRRFDFRMYPCG